MKKVKNKNFTIKIVAVFFSVILWSYVMSEVNPKIDKEIPNVDVELLNIESLEQSNVVIIEPKDITITAKISGRRNEIFDITEKDIVAQADIRGYQEGTYKVPIEVTSPSNADKIEDYYPKNVLIKFDSLIDKQIPVTVKIKGQPKYSYTTGGYNVKPSTVLLRGPKTRINSVEKAVVTVDIGNKSNDVNTVLPYKIVNDKGEEVRGIEKETKLVEVNLPILKMKNVSVNPILQGEPQNGYQITNITTEPNIVKIRGDDDKVKEVFSLKTQPIDIRNITKDINTEVLLDIPQEVELIETNDKAVINIEIEKIVEKTWNYSIDEIQFKNLNQELEIDREKTTDSIDITVKGIESHIYELSKEDIIPYVNADGLNEGNHSLEIKTNNVTIVSVKKINPNKLNITLVRYNEEDDSLSEESESGFQELDNTTQQVIQNDETDVKNNLIE